MESKVQSLDKEVIELDKEIAVLSRDYENIVKTLEETNKTLQDTIETLNRICVRVEKEMVVIDNLQRDVQKFQQYMYGIIVGVVVFVIGQVVLMLH